MTGWECVYGNQATRGRGLQVGNSTSQTASPPSSGSEIPLGIRTGRSTSCVFVDRSGKVENTINFGVMREGDSQEVTTNVALFLAFDSQDATNPKRRGRGRFLADALSRARILDEVDDGETITTRYLLGERDRAAIGTVTAEVLAVALDARLDERQVALDKVDPKAVVVSNARPSDGAAGGDAAGENQLAVAMEIRGHYSPPPELDFDYIVQDSINRDTAAIRRSLRDYNDNCHDQTNKVENQGLERNDFAAVASVNGATGHKKGGASPLDKVFSTACSTGVLAPEYFKSDLKEIRARKVSEVSSLKDAGGVGGNVLYIAEEDAGGLESWAMGPVAAIAGLIVLLVGALVFRRALGPRRAPDKYADSRKTLQLDDDEMRRFGEMGGHMDDGSVDSAFYSDQDDGSDLEETERERRMRRKRNEKSSEQRGGRSDGRPRRKGHGSSGGDKRSRARKDRRDAKLAASLAETDSIGRSPEDSGDLHRKRKGRENREGREGREGRLEKKKSSSGGRREKRDHTEKRDHSDKRDDADRRRERRARKKKAREAAEIV